MVTARPVVNFCFYGLGIVVFLMFYGYLQERIMTKSYDGAKFENSAFLVLTNRVAATVFATVILLASKGRFATSAPLSKYMAVSLSNVVASTCQYESLKYVSFPVQMVAKSFKMMPVMMWGFFVNGRVYGKIDWLIAAAVTGGVLVFFTAGPVSDTLSSSTTGFLLLSMYLGFDGLSSTFQENLFTHYETTTYQQMFYQNLISTFMVTCIVGVHGGFVEVVHFMTAHPEFLRDCLVLSIVGVGAQWFILAQVKEYGALIYAATMNIRQIASIILSYAAYHHQITFLQVIGLSVAMFVLCVRSWRSLLGMREIPSNEGADEEKMLLIKGHPVVRWPGTHPREKQYHSQ